jgi:squalene-hopene/tetraprenyl-beta-curcumene cyclase
VLSLEELRPRLQAALTRATTELLAARSPEGHWVGELSSSALATATAVMALAVAERETQRSRLKAQIDAGLGWLARHANSDGGWGDTDRSLSNLSTTMLCWAAFGAVRGAQKQFASPLDGAERWLKKHVGSLEPERLALAVIQRYGRDRTFSVPILTHCALAGRLGAGREAWRHVIPLPFELAACPHSWFAALRLPVVSYALPALIAIGQARHHHAPSRNPIARMIRVATRRHTLKVLADIQPINGGFLEATPLTSFVVMSLAGSGQVDHAVTERGLKFLKASQRPDGSWPIDTNLSTWLTTLAVNALGPLEPRTSNLEPAIRPWLLAQQYDRKHAYTHAAPGGWAWTDLPGGVPDADDTSGALLALHNLLARDDRTLAAIRLGVEWLLDLQNDDGGLPTFCRGWGALPFDRSSADITAHAIYAWAAWHGELPPKLQWRVQDAIRRAQVFLTQAQRPDGSWVPLWFGHEREPNEENPTYGTARVLSAMHAFPLRPAWAHCRSTTLSRGLNWLLAAQNEDGSWGGFSHGPASVEETALALEALADHAARSYRPREVDDETILSALAAGAGWLIERVEAGTWMEPSPIGFYFAKLWYYERLYPLIFTVGALKRVARLNWSAS